MAQGFLLLVLHAHLPYVRHPEREDLIEERWLMEALTETYIPLVKMMEKLSADQVPFRLTLSLSAPLINMWEDKLLQDRYQRHLDKLLELILKEELRLAGEPQFQQTVRLYHRLLNEGDAIYHRYQRNLNNAFRHFQDSGQVELITCAGTHGYLPLLGLQREVVRAQVAAAVANHTRFFGPPKGIWLPECAFNPGDDEIFKELGLKYFFTETHGILFAEPRPRYGVYAPLACPSGVHAFGRDLESSRQVWSADEGYPGDGDYREFYRDIGHDLDIAYIKDYIHPSGLRLDTGLKYYRVTRRGEYGDSKEAYVAERAWQKADLHAGNFMFNRERQIDYLAAHMDRAPVVVAPYDAELFGHWWFEGPIWLEMLLRKSSFEQSVFQTITASDYLDKYPVNQTAVPCMSSWGSKGYNDVWLNVTNDWIYRHLHQAARSMTELANQFPYAVGVLRRALNQAAREVLLAQASDWAFIMETGTMVDYAIKRTKNHVGRFQRLQRDIISNCIDVEWLSELEHRDNNFPEIDFQVFATTRQAP